MNKLEIGDIIQWECNPYSKPKFIAEGIILEFKNTTFGSKKKSIGIRVEPFNEDWFICYPNRKTTVISYKNILK